ncbi:MAG TPA: phage late control D family protein [Anaerolineae bacterium]|nr:phage late control D family protein [Anaerolineae bacterium]
MPDITYTLLIDDAPASPEVMEGVQEIHVENGGDMADIFRIRIALGMTDRGDWTTLQDDRFKPLTPVTIRVQVGIGPSEPLISGYVTSNRVSINNEPGQSSLEIVGMDATVLMNLEEKVVAWPNMADSDIATAVFGNYGFTPQVDQTQPVRQDMDVTTIQRGTDIQFLRRLAERNGFECYVENDPLLNADVGHFHSPELQGKAQGILSVSFGPNTNVSSFNARYDMLQATTARISEMDINSKSVQTGQADNLSELTLGREDVLGRISLAPVVLPSKPGLFSAAELQTFCQAVVNRSAWAVSAEGEVETGVYEGILRARRTVNVRGAGDLYSGTYYVTRVFHTLSGVGYTQRFELQKNAIGLSGAEVFMDTGALV